MEGPEPLRAPTQGQRHAQLKQLVLALVLGATSLVLCLLLLRRAGLRVPVCRGNCFKAFCCAGRSAATCISLVKRVPKNIAS